MHPESNYMEDYLVSDYIIDWDDSAVYDKAMELADDTQDDIHKARVLYDWVRDEIPHSNDIGSEVVTCTASEVLGAGTGICFAKSHLLAALLRAKRIPAGFCYQVLRSDPPIDNQLILHGLNGIYLSSIGRWIRLDARGNTGDVNAQFSLDHEQLAFPMDPSYGEMIYDAIYKVPAKSVIERLRKYKKRSELWSDLPKAF